MQVIESRAHSMQQERGGSKIGTGDLGQIVRRPAHEILNGIQAYYCAGPGSARTAGALVGRRLADPADLQGGKARPRRVPGDAISRRTTRFSAGVGPDFQLSKRSKTIRSPLFQLPTLNGPPPASFNEVHFNAQGSSVVACCRASFLLTT